MAQFYYLAVPLSILVSYFNTYSNKYSVINSSSKSGANFSATLIPLWVSFIGLTFEPSLFTMLLPTPVTIIKTMLK